MQHMIFDAHLHIIDPSFPLVSNDGFLPEPFTVDDYVGRTAQLGIGGGAVVSGSYQSYDQQYLRAALKNLGPSFVGVTQLPPDVTDEEILALAAERVRGLRFNMHRCGSEQASYLSELAARVFELAGWHVEIYADYETLSRLHPQICALPSVSIDHLGLSKDGLPLLYEMVERGVRVKATGFGRVDFAVSQVVRRLYEIDPGALMFGTDLPSTRSPRPFNPVDLEIIANALDDKGTKRVLWDNAAAFYRLHME